MPRTNPYLHYQSDLLGAGYTLCQQGTINRPRSHMTPPEKVDSSEEARLSPGVQDVEKEEDEKTVLRRIQS